MADRVGQQLGNYRLVRLIGSGGFADVYLGEHVYLNTPVAVKILQAKVADDDLQGFLNEARTIAHLVHPHIVRVMDFGVQDEIPFLVMDYASNGTLRKLHPKGTQLPLSTIVSYVRQVAFALQYAHDEKFIHRDIKPENMLLGRRTEVLLSDFGIALIAQSSRYQNTRDVAGTVAYMAPEQIQGKPRPPSDQYSLAVVVYEWLSGDRPFHGSFTELCAQHLFAPPPSLREKTPTISLDVEQVVQTALSKEPQQRFKSVLAFANALEQASRPEQPVFLSSQAGLTSLPTVSAEQPAENVATPLPSAETKQVKMWQMWRSIGVRQLVAMVLGVLLYGALTYYIDFSYLNSSPLVTTSLSVFNDSIDWGIVFIGLALIIPLFFGTIFGPLVGLVTVLVGTYLGNRLANYSVAAYYGVSWTVYVGQILVGLVAGLAIFRTGGRYDTFRSIATAVVISAAATIIGAAFAAFVDIAVSRITIADAWTGFTRLTLPPIIDLIVLPVLLVAYNALVKFYNTQVERRRRG